MPGTLSLRRRLTQIAEILRLPLHRNGLALLFGAGATSVLGLAYWVLAARLYPPATVGLNSALLSAVLFLSGIGQLGVNAVLIRFVPQAGRHTARLIGLGYLLALGVALLATLIFFMGLQWWAPSLAFAAQGLGWPLALLAAVLGWCLFSLQDNALTGLRQAMWVPFENSLFAVAKIVLLVIFARRLAAFGIVTSWVVPAIALILPVNLLIFARLAPRHAAEQAAAEQPLALDVLWRFGAGNFVSSLFFVIYNTLLPVLVTNQLGASANAYFYLPWTIATSIQLIGLSLASSLVVEAALDADKLRDYAGRILKTSFALLFPVALVFALGARLVLQIYGAAYAGAGTWLLIMLVIAAFPSTLIAVAVGLMRAQNRNRQLVFSQGVLCVLALGLAYALLPRYGINGVGLAWLVAQTAVAVYLLPTEFWPLFRPAVRAQTARLE